MAAPTEGVAQRESMLLRLMELSLVQESSASVVQESQLRVGTCLFDQENLSLVDMEGKPVPLRGQSMRVLALLARHRGAVVYKDTIAAEIWPGVAVTDDSLIQCISDIRAALSDRDRKVVRTVAGRGYCLQALPERHIGRGARPRLLISRFRTSASSPAAVEIAEAMAEQLVIDLSPRAGLLVMTDEARRPEAQYVIDGRVSAYRENVRVYVRIQKLDTAANILADTWMAPLENAEELPRSISQKVTNMLRIHLITFGGEEYATQDDARLSLQDLLSKAAYHMARFKMENWQAARRALEMAVDRDPQNPIALAMLASMATQMTPQVPFAAIPDRIERVLELADRAVELGPNIDFVMRTRGNLRLWMLKDHDGCRADCLRALQINPTFHLAHLTLATSEILDGKPRAGLERMRRMMSLAVNEPQYPLFMSLIALAHLLLGNSAEALEAARESHERLPSDSWSALVYAAAAAGRPDITETSAFRQVVGAIHLPFSHFRDLPFTQPSDVWELEDRLRAVGFRVGVTQ